MKKLCVNLVYFQRSYYGPLFISYLYITFVFLELLSRPGFEYFHIISMPVTVPSCSLHKWTYCHFRLQYIFALNALDYGTKSFLFLRYRVHFVPMSFKLFSHFFSQVSIHGFI